MYYFHVSVTTLKWPVSSGWHKDAMRCCHVSVTTLRWAGHRVLPCFCDHIEVTRSPSVAMFLWPHWGDPVIECCHVSVTWSPNVSKPDSMMPCAVAMFLRQQWDDSITKCLFWLAASCHELLPCFYDNTEMTWSQSVSSGWHHVAMGCCHVAVTTLRWPDYWLCLFLPTLWRHVWTLMCLRQHCLFWPAPWRHVWTLMCLRQHCLFCTPRWCHARWPGVCAGCRPGWMFFGRCHRQMAWCGSAPPGCVFSSSACSGLLFHTWGTATSQTGRWSVQAGKQAGRSRWG